VYTAIEYVVNIAGSARLSSVPTTYDASSYSETGHTFTAVIRSLSDNEDHFAFLASTSVVDSRHMNAFNGYGVKTTFINTKSRVKFDRYLFDMGYGRGGWQSCMLYTNTSRLSWSK
jgi:hypothetical protein